MYNSGLRIIYKKNILFSKMKKGSKDIYIYAANTIII